MNKSITFFLGFIFLNAFCALHAENSAEITKKNEEVFQTETVNEEQAENGEIKISIEEKKSEEKKEDDIGTIIGNKVSEIINEIERRVPKIIENRKNFYIEGIRGFLGQFGPELDYISDESEIQNRGNQQPVEYHKPIIIASQKILYIRIDGFSEENFKKLKEECIDISKYKNQPIGIIFDIRSGAGENVLLSAEYASLFVDSYLLFSTKNTFKALFKVPIMIIVSSKTSGAAEVFAQILIKSGKAILAGDKTCGTPFPKYPVKLKSGGALLLPEIPSDLSWIESKPIEPAIAIKTDPQIEYSLISGEKNSEKKDEAIRRLCDLLISLEALHKQR